MGKGDKKTRRGKIILGSFGVRRPKLSKSKAITNVKSSADTAPVKVKKATAVKAEAKPKIKAPEVAEVAEVAKVAEVANVAEVAVVAVTAAAVEETTVAAAPKPVKKTVKKAKTDDAVEK